MSYGPSAREPSPSAKIATSAVQVLREYTGSRPTKAKTTIGEGVVTILLAEALTTGERTLIEHGHADRVLQVRDDYQTAMRDELIGIVERELDREVIAFMSQNHIDPTSQSRSSSSCLLSRSSVERRTRN